MKTTDFKTTKQKLIALVIVITLSAIIFSWPHFAHPIPIHGDEWVHVAFSEHNDYFNWEIGFQRYLTGINILLDGNLIQNWATILLIINLFNALIVFFISWYLIKNFWISLFSIPLYFSLPTTNQILGIHFLVPLTLIIFIFYWYIYSVEMNLLKIWHIFLLIPYFLIHPTTVIFLSFCLLIHYWSRFSKKIKLFLIYFFSASLLILLISEKFIKIINLLVWVKGRTGTIEEIYSPFIFFWFIDLIVIIGLYILTKNKSFAAKIFWISTGLQAIFWTTGISFIAQYERIFYYSILLMPIFFVVGVKWIFVKLKYKKNIKRILTFLMFLMLFSDLIYLTKTYSENFTPAITPQEYANMTASGVDIPDMMRYYYVTGPIPNLQELKKERIKDAKNNMLLPPKG